VERFAVLSDIHANLGALDACLARIDALSASAGLPGRMPIIILGDVLDSGPDPAGTLARVVEVGDVFLRGNHEDYVFDYARNPRAERYKDPLWTLIPWSFRALGRSSVEAYRERCIDAHALLGGRVRFFHASVESNARSPAFFGNQDAIARAGGGAPPLPVTFEGAAGALCFAGHNHYAGVHVNPAHATSERHREVWINAGSVGYPFVEKDPDHPGDPVATFVTAEVATEWEVKVEAEEKRGHGNESLSVRVEFHRVAHDGAALLRAFVDSGCLEACDPFARAILCQCYFNEDVTYPFFREAKRQGWRQAELPGRLRAYLVDRGYEERLSGAFFGRYR
jgi:hypothetical protein